MTMELATSLQQPLDRMPSAATIFVSVLAVFSLSGRNIFFPTGVAGPDTSFSARCVVYVLILSMNDRRVEASG